MLPVPTDDGRNEPTETVCRNRDYGSVKCHKTMAVESDHASFGSQPDKPVFVLGDGFDAILGKAILVGKML
ncbi:hypothetical protein GCM10007423_27130 [Dyadobacter endophyticus]|uniref:Uncharacterized protein n=1 Tax=Dyadobacter endophyticus TaxID=1749036 RepID=A0ABQ1YT18_9BACT|nr:hypothetical protein GCM10007423_27130 [Dyadobacter endophyticus]